MMNNQAFIDAQNLYLNTVRATTPWILDLARFRAHLTQKCHVNKAYYFAGAYESNQDNLYAFIEQCGYILQFHEHATPFMSDKRKDSVEADIVFLIMKKLHRKEDFDKVVLISGDGDYGRLVRFLIEEGRLEKLIVPSRAQTTMHYGGIDARYMDVLGSKDKRGMLGYKKQAK
jgi:uncharacterized LabA/DUF88 family protein